MHTEAKVVALEAEAMYQERQAASEWELSKREHAVMLQLEAEQERAREREQSLRGENASTVYFLIITCMTRLRFHHHRPEKE